MTSVGQGAGGGGAILMVAFAGVNFSGNESRGDGEAAIFGTFSGSFADAAPAVSSYSAWTTLGPSDYYLYSGGGGGGGGGDGQSTLQPATISLSSSQNPSVYSAPVTFAAVINPSGATGTTWFYDGTNLLGTAAVNSAGQAAFTTSTLTVGNHSITAEYGGNGTYASVTSSAVMQTVNKDATTTAVTSAVNPTIFGQGTTVTASVAAAAPGAGTPTGTVNFVLGATVLGSGTLTAGTASFTTSSLGVGAGQVITVQYLGDTNFTSSSGTVSQTVNQANTTSSITVAPSSTNYGQSLTLAGTVAAASPGAGTPSGTVTFTLDGSPVSGNIVLNGAAQATFSIATVTGGSHSFAVVYGGDTNFLSSTSASVTQTVATAATSVSLSCSGSPSSYGQAVTLTAAVTTPVTTQGIVIPSGTVKFYDGSALIGQATLGSSTPTCTVSTSTLTGGTHSLTAVYFGDGNYSGSTSSGLTQTVNRAGTTTSLSSNPSGLTMVMHGSTITFSGSVSTMGAGQGLAALNGTLYLYDGSTQIGSVTLTNGTTTYSFSITFNTTGQHHIVAKYRNDSNWADSDSGSIDFMVM